jgi:flagellar basal body-associated protein FliL
MAEQTSNDAAAPAKRFPLKTLVVLLVVLLIEGLAISAAFIFSQGPDLAKADAAAIDEAARAEQPVELLVVADRFQNTRTGRAYLYDTEIYVVIKSKYQQKIESDIEHMQAAISTDIATVFRRAEPAHLLEHELSTLNRQIRAALDKRMGYDEEGQPYIQEVLIRKCHQFRADM